jgi:hypothetical protein
VIALETTMPEPRQHMDHRGVLETILRHIPGFRGYLEKEYRRDSDALQRQWLADRLQQAKRALDTVGVQLVDAGRLPLLTRYDRLRAQLDLVIARIRGAWQGYSAVFDLAKVNTTLLDQIYEHDLASMQAVEEFSAILARVVGQPASGSLAGMTQPAMAAVTPSEAGNAMPAANTAPTATAAASATPAVTSTTAVPAAVTPPTPLDAEAALPLLENQLSALAQASDQRAELLKGLG